MPSSAEASPRRRRAAAVLLVLAAGLAAGCDAAGIGQPVRTTDPTTCPELVLDPIPDGYRVIRRRRLLPDRPVSPLRVDLAGPGDRRLVLISGETQEFAGAPIGRHVVVGHEALLVRTPAGSLALSWVDERDEDCPGYALIAEGHAVEELDRLIGSLAIRGQR